MAFVIVAPRPASARPEPARPGVRESSLSSNTVAALQAGIGELYTLDFDAADRWFSRVTAASSNHPAGYVYLALTAMARILVEGESPGRQEELRSRIQTATVKAIRGVIRGDDPWVRLYAGAAFLLQSCREGRQEHYIDALRWLKRAIVQINSACASPATQDDAYVLIGAYQYFLSQTPWSIRFFSALLIEPNDRQMGIDHLEQGMARAVFSRNEARLLLSTAYTWEHQTERAHECVNELVKRYPRNPLVAALKEQVLIQEHRYEDALASATATVHYVMTDARLRGLLPDRCYDVGLLYMYQTNYARALSHFSQAYAAGSNKPAIRAWAALRTGMMCDRLNRREEACRWYTVTAGMNRLSDLAGHYARVFLREAYRGEMIE